MTTSSHIFKFQLKKCVEKIIFVNLLSARYVTNGMTGAACYKAGAQILPFEQLLILSNRTDIQNLKEFPDSQK